MPLEQALKSDVESLQREPARYRPNFRSARGRHTPGHTARWLDIVQGRDIVVAPPPLSFRGCALMPGRSEKPARDGQGGFRGGMKGRRIKGTRYGERARGTWVGNPGLL